MERDKIFDAMGSQPVKPTMTRIMAVSVNGAVCGKAPWPPCAGPAWPRTHVTS
jgi:hypothetical protein